MGAQLVLLENLMMSSPKLKLASAWIELTQIAIKFMAMKIKQKHVFLVWRLILMLLASDNELLLPTCLLALICCWAIILLLIDW